MKSWLGVLLLLLLVHPALAGGDAEDAVVRHLVIEGKRFSVVLVPRQSNRFSVLGFGKCRVFTIFGTLDRSKWLQRHSSGPDLASHSKALKFLREASSTGTAVRFGYMGTGWKVIDNADPCVVESNGLEAFESPKDNFRAVYSYY